MADTRNQNNPQQASPQQQQASPQNSGRREEARDPGSIDPTRAADLARSGGADSPFSFMRRFVSDMDRMFEDFGLGRSATGHVPARARLGDTLSRSAWAPQVDVFERGGQLVVHADLPGVRQDEVQLNLLPDDTLVISGERSHTHEHEKGGVYQCERSYGSFHRAIPLPDGVDPESIRASFDNGVLEVAMPMPREQSSRGRTIPIAAKSTGGVKH
jgi:HSP20 family protein